MEKSLAPVWRIRQKPDLSARCWGSAAISSRFQRRAKEQAADQSLVLQCQGARSGQGKDDMIVGDREQFGQTLGQPDLACAACILGACRFKTL